MEETIEVIEEIEEQQIEVEEENCTFGTPPTGTIAISTNGEHNVTQYANADVQVFPVLQAKELTITNNGDTTITADEGYYGIENVAIHTNVTGARTELPDGIKFQQSGSNELNFLENFDTNNVTTLYSMFNSCTEITSLNIGHFNVGKVDDMRYAFASCTNLTTLNLGNWDTSKVRYVANAFDDCSNLENLNIDNWNLSIITMISNFNNMFGGCRSLSNASLNSILKALSTNTRNFTQKKLSRLGITQAQCETMATLSNWQACVNAGWVTGY